MREQVAQQTYIRRTSANNGLPYRQQFYQQETEEYEDVWPPRMPKSAIRYTTTQAAPQVFRNGNKKYVVHNSPPPQTQRATKYQEEEDEPRQRRHRVHWSLIFGIGMFVMLALWILGNIAVNWWNVTQEFSPQFSSVEGFALAESSVPYGGGPNFSFTRRMAFE